MNNVISLRCAKSNHCVNGIYDKVRNIYLDFDERFLESKN